MNCEMSFSSLIHFKTWKKPPPLHIFFKSHTPVLFKATDLHLITTGTAFVKYNLTYTRLITVVKDQSESNTLFFC